MRVSPKLRRFLGVWKRMPREPSPEWFEENLRAIVRRLKENGITVAVCSLGVVGEDPASTNAVQRQVNDMLREYSGIIGRVASEEAVAYIPFYERFVEAISREPGPPFAGLRILSMYRDAFRLLVLHWSVDDVGAKNGWRFHTDGIHLNSRGGRILADAVEEFLRSEVALRAPP